MKANRKGFTITELVIVIVVIAILAAVLIPTFASLIKKANISADTQMAKNLNTALTMYEASGNKVDDFSEALDAMRAAGYLLANMNPTADGCYLAWEKETNQVLLVELSDNTHKVLYHAKENYGEPDNSWYFAVKDQATADAIKAVLANVNTEMTILDTSSLNTEINADGDKTVHIDGSIEMDDNNVIKLNNPNANTTIDLGDSEIIGGSTNAAVAAVPFYVESGKLTLKNGVINATGQIIDADGKVTDVSVMNDPGSYLKIDGSTINVALNGEAGYVALYGDADVLNANITSGNCGINAGGGSTVTVEGTTMTSNYGFFVTNAGNEATGNSTKLVINSGTYETLGNGISGYMFEVYNGNVEINGGTFKTKYENKVFYFYTADDTITIKGGTFNGKDFSAIATADAWKAMVGGTRDVDVTISNGVVTITSK